MFWNKQSSVFVSSLLAVILFVSLLSPASATDSSRNDYDYEDGDTNLTTATTIKPSTENISTTHNGTDANVDGESRFALGGLMQGAAGLAASPVGQAIMGAVTSTIANAAQAASSAVIQTVAQQAQAIGQQVIQGALSGGGGGGGEARRRRRKKRSIPNVDINKSLAYRHISPKAIVGSLYDTKSQASFPTYGSLKSHNTKAISFTTN